jgi:hypothetical protein
MGECIMYRATRGKSLYIQGRGRYHGLCALYMRVLVLLVGVWYVNVFKLALFFGCFSRLL